MGRGMGKGCGVGGNEEEGKRGRNGQEKEWMFKERMEPRSGEVEIMGQRWLKGKGMGMVGREEKENGSNEYSIWLWDGQEMGG